MKIDLNTVITRAALVTILAYANPVFATVYTWSGAVNDDYNNVGNWDLGAVPGSADIALFQAGPVNKAITLTGAINNTGTLTFNTPGYSITANASSELTLSNGINGTSSASLVSNGASELNWLGGSAGLSTITNNGGGINFQGASTAGGAAIANNAGGTVNFLGGANAGSSVITGNGSFINLAGVAGSPNAKFVMNGAGDTIVQADSNIGSLSGSAGVALNDNTLTLGNLNLNDTISGIISGVGGNITKVGTGTLTLSGANTYDGTTTVLGGNVSTAGAFTGPASISIGSTLSVGSYAPPPATPLAIGADPASTASGLLNSSGGVTLPNADLNVTFIPGIPLPFEHVIVQGSSVTGTFNSVTSIPAMLVPQLTYNPTNVTMLIQGLTISQALTTGLSPDELSVVNELDDIFVSPGISAAWQNAHATFNTFSAAQLKQAVDALVPDGASQAKGAVNVSTSNQVNRILFNRSRAFVQKAHWCAKKTVHTPFKEHSNQLLNKFAGNKDRFADNMLSPSWAQTDELKRLSAAGEMAENVDRASIWIQPFGSVSRLRTTANQIGYNARTGGIVVGVDRPITHDFMLGVSGGYGYSRLKFANGTGHSNIQNTFMSLYSTMLKDNLHGDASITGSLQEFREGRNIAFTTVNTSAFNHHRGAGFNAHLGLGYNYMVDETIVEPFVNGDFYYNREHGYTENGAGIFDLAVRSQRASQIQGEVGFKVFKTIKQHDMNIVPLFSLSYVASNPIKKSKMISSFVGESGNIITAGTNRSRNYVSVGASSTFYSHASGHMFGVEYDGNFNERYMSNQALMTYTIPL